MVRVRRGRGRTRKPNALSNADRQRRWRRRREAERVAHPARVVNESVWWKLQRWDRDGGAYVDTGVHAVGSLDYLVATAFSHGIRGGVKEAVRARLRLYVKRILKECGYPPSGQDAATRTVLQQAELLCAGWT